MNSIYISLKVGPLIYKSFLADLVSIMNDTVMGFYADNKTSYTNADSIDELISYYGFLTIASN